MTRMLRLRKRVMLWSEINYTRLWWVNTAGQWVICRIAGHDPERDHCGRPEHDFCLWCHKSMPHAADAVVVERRAKRLRGDR